MESDADAFGRALRAHHEGEEAFEIVERDDGFVSVGPGPAYFAEYEDWPACERRAMDHVEGRVLDVGCGAGRHALHLQDRGRDVVGIDVSPGAIEVCRGRGLDRAEVLDVTDVAELDGPFDTALMLGNNFGLVGTAERAPAVLGALAEITASDALLVAQSMDPHDTDHPAHRASHERNRERGRLPGAIRQRVRFEQYATDWYDYLHASLEEMREVVADTPWQVTETDECSGGTYVGLLRKGER
jgi:SAM-dependent methyltransferase